MENLDPVRTDLDAHMSVITFEHRGGSHILIKEIGVLLAQSVKPFIGVFARMGFVDNGEESLFGDLGGDVIP